MRVACGDMRDHIVSYQNDHRPSYWRRRALRQQERLRIDFRDATVSAISRHVLHLRLPARGSLATGYIGGGIPSLPTVTRLASNAPSGVLIAAGIKIFAFGFSSLPSPGTSVTTSVSDVTVTILVPPLILTVTSFASTLLIVFFSTLLAFCVTVSMVMLFF